MTQSARQRLDDRGLSTFRVLRLHKAADQVILVVVDAIRGGVFEVGDILPRERELAERLAVSRPTVREALSALQRAGILDVSRGPNGGYSVISVENLSQVQRTIQGESLSGIRELLEARRVIETWAAVACGERADDKYLADLLVLANALRAAVAAGDSTNAIREVDARFHVALVKGAANHQILVCYRSVLDGIFALRDEYPIGHVDFDQAVENQIDTAAALASRDSSRIRVSVDKHLASLESVYLGTRLPE